MIDSKYRHVYQFWAVDPLLPYLLRWNFSPAWYTCGALLTGIAVMPCLALHYVWTAFVFLLLSGFLDTLDGSIARAKKATSPFGAVIDIVSDRVVESAVVVGLYLFDTETRALPCLLMLSSICICVTSFLVVGIFLENSSEKGFHYSPGLIERAEAFVFFGAMILIPAAFQILAYLFAGLVLYTALCRVLRNQLS